MPSRVINYASGLSLVPSLSSSSRLHSFSFLHMDNCLRLLDSYLLGRWTEPDDSAPVVFPELDPEDGHITARLLAICALVDILSRDDGLQDLRPIGALVFNPPSSRTSDDYVF